jgi:hypothetical protein
VFIIIEVIVYVGTPFDASKRRAKESVSLLRRCAV